MSQAPIKRFVYALLFLGTVAVVVATSAVLLSNIVNAGSEENTPKQINQDQVIHSKVIHRAIIEQLSILGGDVSGYLPGTLSRTVDTSIDNDGALVSDLRYVGNITTNNGQQYHVEIDLLTVASEVIPLATTLTLIEE